jgi:hypothetical protein
MLYSEYLQDPNIPCHKLDAAGAEELYLSSEDVLALQEIQSISLDYPIVVASKEDLFTLARHRTLQEACLCLELDLSLVKATLYFLEHLEKVSYKYTFFTSPDFSIIQISPENLFVRSIDQESLLCILERTYPSRYTGPFYPCLTESSSLVRVDLVFSEEGFQNWLHEELLFPRALRSYYISWPQGDISYNTIISKFLLQCQHLKRVCTRTVDSFFPLPLYIHMDDISLSEEEETLDYYKDYLPKCSSLYLTSSSISLFREKPLNPRTRRQASRLQEYLQGYTQIIIVQDTSEPNFLPDELFSGLIKILPSSWLM